MTVDIFHEKADRVFWYAQECVGIAWDGCHKIYILQDHGQVHQMAQYGYGDGTDGSVLEIEGRDFERTDQVVERLQDWWENSCGLRFIQACQTPLPGADPNTGFEDVIIQFAEDY